MIKNETNEEKSLIGIDRGKGNEKQEKTYINSATVQTGNQGKSSHYNCMRDFNYNMNKKEPIKRRNKRKNPSKMYMKCQSAGKAIQSA